MKNTKETVLEFLDKCEELKNCKFIMATSKIKDLLKCIVNSRDLYTLFDAVTATFNYPQAKEQYFVCEGSGMFLKYSVKLPATVGERLAFIFCLFVEFDENTLNFNDFLQRYFMKEDRSFYASYHAFCDEIVCALQEAIAQVFREQLVASDLPKTEEGEDKEVSEGVEASAPAAIPTPAVNPAKAELLSAIELTVAEEIDALGALEEVSADEKSCGETILNCLVKALRSGDMQTACALLGGYNYFALYHGCSGERLEALINAINAYGDL